MVKRGFLHVIVTVLKKQNYVGTNNKERNADITCNQGYIYYHKIRSTHL